MASPKTSIPAPKMPAGGILVSTLNWLALKNLRHRQREQLRHLSNETLRDVGLSRQQANQEFYHRTGNRPADRERLSITVRGWPFFWKHT